METVRFDSETSIAATAPSSGASTAPLARTTSSSVAVVTLESGGLLVLTPGEDRRLLGVVSGAGWAKDPSGRMLELPALHGCIWEAGERLEVGSDRGMTAVLIRGALELHAYQVTRDIVVVDYDEHWPIWFEDLRSFLSPELDPSWRIEHVGSTAVPGLAAKPIIDLDVVVPSDDDVPDAVDQLESLGYRWRGDLGVVGREAFAVPRTADLPPHHLYVVVENNRAHQDHWLLRDVLRSDPVSRERYAALKKRNAVAADRNLDSYVEAKADLVVELLARARAEEGRE